MPAGDVRRLHEHSGGCDHVAAPVSLELPREWIRARNDGVFELVVPGDMVLRVAGQLTTVSDGPTVQVSASHHTILARTVQLNPSDPRHHDVLGIGAAGDYRDDMAARYSAIRARTAADSRREFYVRKAREKLLPKVKKVPDVRRPRR